MKIEPLTAAKNAKPEQTRKISGACSEVLMANTVVGWVVDAEAEIVACVPIAGICMEAIPWVVAVMVVAMTCAVFAGALLVVAIDLTDGLSAQDEPSHDRLTTSNVVKPNDFDMINSLIRRLV